jgi:T5orf172 domain.
MSKESAGEALADTVFRFSLEDDQGQELDGWIYLIACEQPLSLKIGFTTKHPRTRLKQLQTGNPNKLKLIGWFPGSLQSERDIHDSLAEFRLHGEWFSLTPEANEALRGPVTLARINNTLCGYDPETAE